MNSTTYRYRTRPTGPGTTRPAPSRRVTPLRGAVRGPVGSVPPISMPPGLHGPRRKSPRPRKSPLTFPPASLQCGSVGRRRPPHPARVRVAHPDDSIVDRRTTPLFAKLRIESTDRSPGRPGRPTRSPLVNAPVGAMPAPRIGRRRRAPALRRRRSLPGPEAPSPAGGDSPYAGASDFHSRMRRAFFSFQGTHA